MHIRRNITIILSFVIILAITIELTRAEFVIQLNKNKNLELINYLQATGNEIDKNLLENAAIEKYLIIYDPEEEGLLSAKENFERVFNYIKKDYEAIAVDEVNTINQRYNTVILIVEDMNKFKDIDGLMKYVFDGGNLFFTHRLDVNEGFYQIYRKLGINEAGGYLDAFNIRLFKNVLIKGDGLEIIDEDMLVNSSVSLKLDHDSEKFAESTNGIPLLWKKKYGQGNIAYFNGTMLDIKINRGFILGILSLLEEDFIYPIMNAKVSFIDDFPAPIPEGNHEKITREFKRNIFRFYKDIWWPDMLEIAEKYNIKYTGVVIGTYNDEVKNIRPGSADLNIKDYIYYGRELITHGGEIGIHGYNHQPLALKELFDKELEYKPWKNIDTMVDAIEEINDLSKKAFPNYTFRVYVPPSNILYPEGREALKGADADIQIISSLYNLYGRDEYAQEFSISSDGIIEFPRFTSGYMNTQANLWMTLNGITAHGAFSHFIHPDDILDDERSGDKGWTELVEGYDEFNKIVYDNHRWLRGMTASEGANEMIKYLLCQPRFEKSDTYLRGYSNNFFDKMFFILRTEKEIKSTENCKIERIDEHTYLIESTEPIYQINFKR